MAVWRVRPKRKSSCADGFVAFLSIGEKRLVYDLNSPVRGNMRVTLHEVPFKRFKEIGPGFWNIRASFKVPPSVPPPRRFRFLDSILNRLLVASWTLAIT
jgi:hypothetical protein